MRLRTASCFAVVAFAAAAVLAGAPLPSTDTADSDGRRHIVIAVEAAAPIAPGSWWDCPETAAP